MRKPAVVVAALCALTVAALVVVALAQRTSLAFTLGVASVIPAVGLDPGDEGCQTPISVPGGGEFDRVVLHLGTYRRPGPEVEVEVRDRAADGRVIGRGTLAAGYADIGREPEHAIRVGEIPAGRQIDVCVLNRGSTKVAVFGNADAASRTSAATFNGQPAGVDMTMVFERSPRSLASLTGALADRAALFKLGWIGGWTFWLLAALVLLAVPVLLVRAVRGLEE